VSKSPGGCVPAGTAKTGPAWPSESILQDRVKRGRAVSETPWRARLRISLPLVAQGQISQARPPFSALLAIPRIGHSAGRRASDGEDARDRKARSKQDCSRRIQVPESPLGAEVLGEDSMSARF
jgi:hypothetical protein